MRFKDVHRGSGVPGHFLVFSTMISSLGVQGPLAIGSGVSPESGIWVWLCQQIGKLQQPWGYTEKPSISGKKYVLVGSLVEGALLERWHHLLPAQQDVAWPHHAVPAWQDTSCPTLCKCPELLLGDIARAKWLPVRRRRVKASLCTMTICHLLPGQTPDAGFNLP